MSKESEIERRAIIANQRRGDERLAFLNLLGRLQPLNESQQEEQESLENRWRIVGGGDPLTAGGDGGGFLVVPPIQSLKSYE